MWLSCNTTKCSHNTCFITCGWPGTPFAFKYLWGSVYKLGKGEKKKKKKRGKEEKGKRRIGEKKKSGKEEKKKRGKKGKGEKQ